MEQVSLSWSSYPSIFALGHRAIRDLLQGAVNVEEKVDGSQFSFGLVPANVDDAGNPVDAVWSVEDGVSHALKVRSKGAVIQLDAPEALFREAVETVKWLAPMLHPGWTYRSEVLKKPHHNALTYERVPRTLCECNLEGEEAGEPNCEHCKGHGFVPSHIILFDVNTGNQEYLDYEAKTAEATRLGLEVVPLLFQVA